jgi:hypothetical protein
MGSEWKCLTDELAHATEQFVVAAKRADGSPAREREFERAADARWDAEEAVLRQTPQSLDDLELQLAILARRAEDGLDIACELTALVAHVRSIGQFNNFPTKATREVRPTAGPLALTSLTLRLLAE